VHRPAEVGDLQVAVDAEQKILGFYVAVDHLFWMTIA
jgi:hypothetical protein